MVFSTFLESLAHIASMLINIYIWVLIIAVLLSWVKPDPYNPIVQVLTRLSEPLFAKVRSLVPTSFGGIDFAPLIAIVVLKFIDLMFVRLLLKYAQGL